MSCIIFIYWYDALKKQCLYGENRIKDHEKKAMIYRYRSTVITI